MPSRPLFRRRTFLINKQFQFSFAIRFLVLIVFASAAALALFLYNSTGTLTTSYNGSELTILRTSSFFLPVLVMSTIGVIIVTCVIGILVLIYLSHQIAGPIFRFEQVLNEIDKGNLTHRFTLRDNDQFAELAVRINELAGTMDGKLGAIKTQTSDLCGRIKDLQNLAASHPSPRKEFERTLLDIANKAAELQAVANHFNTSPHDGK